MPAPGAGQREAPPNQLSDAEWRVTLLVAAVQFVNILDFIIIMPLGPQFARALAVGEDKLGVVNAAYTGAAALAGLAGAFFLDRFDRRSALAVAISGLVLGTAVGGFAWDLPSLLLARVVAGAFGGPATSLSFSIISDAIRGQVRGRAMGAVMAAFSLASVLGVPAGLWLAEHFSWRAPFFAVAGVGAFIAVGAVWLLPPMRGHLADARGPQPSLLELLSRPVVLLSYAMTAVVMGGGFLLIPNIPAYLQLNLGFPEDQLKFAYLFGGVASFLALQAGGRLVDRFGSARVGAAGALAFIAVVYAVFYLPHTSLPPWAVFLSFVGFMLANGTRNVAYNTLTSKVPEAAIRARFQSIQSSVQHGATALAAFSSSQLLTVVPRPAQPGDAPGRAVEQLAGMPTVTLVSMLLTALIPLLLYAVESTVRRRQEPGPALAPLRAA